jgi:hypothetical protein
LVSIAVLVACFWAIAAPAQEDATNGVAAPAAAPTAQPASGAASTETPLERLPYSIRLWVAVDPATRIDARGRERVLATWTGMVERFVGQPWKVAIAPGDGPLLGASLDDLTAETLAPLSRDVDKAWVVRLESNGRGGISLAGREYDTTTGILGLVCRQEAAVVLDAPRALFLLVREMFSPSAEVGAQSAGGVLITVKGSALPAADPAGRVIDQGSVFRPVRLLYKPDGSLLRPDLVRRSYLTVEAMEGNQARCTITSPLRDPLTRMVAGRSKLVAVGIRPSGVPSRFQFVTGPQNDRKPAAGYSVTARPAGTAVALEREVATTDRDGRVSLPPGVGAGLTLLRVVAGGIEPLVEFPMMPGEVADEQLISIDLKPQALALESELLAMRDEILDLIAARSRLDALLKTRAEGEAWDDVKALLEEYKPLLVKESFDQRLTKLETDAIALQEQLKRPVRTRTAQNLIMDTRALIERYLDSETYAAYEDGYERWLAQSGRSSTASAGTPGGTPPGAPATGASSGPPAPSVSFTSPDGSWSVLLPGRPESITVATPAGASAATAFRYTQLEQGVYTLEDVTYPQTLSGDSLKQAIDAVRDATLASVAGGSVTQERPIQQAGGEGREIVMEVPSAPGGVETALRMRCIAAGPRLLVAIYAGHKPWVTAQGAVAFLNSLRLASGGTPAPGDVASAPKAPAATPGTPTKPAAAATKPATATPKAAEKSKSGGGVVPF